MAQRQSGVALLLLLLPCLALLFCLQRLESHRQAGAPILLAAADQAVLPQRLASLATSDTTALSAAAQAEYRTILADLVNSHALLINGPRAPARLSAELAQTYFNADGLITHMAGFLADARAVSAQIAKPGPSKDASQGNAAGSSDAVVSLRQRLPALETATQQALAQQQDALQQQSQRDLAWALGALGLLVLALALEWFLIFLPLAKTIANHTKTLLQEARTDPMTGLAKRDSLLIDVSDALARGHALAVIAIDLDWFGDFNDAEGRTAADALLRALATRLRSATRQGDALGQLAGDKFMVVLAGIEGEEACRNAAERLRAALQIPVPVGDNHLRLRVALGVAFAAPGRINGGDAMRAAEDALRRAHHDGITDLVFANEGDFARLEREAILTRSLKTYNGAPPGLTVHLQPQFTLQERSLQGFEALARWTHPELGEVPPGEFLPLALRCGVLQAVSAQVRRAAFAAVASLRTQGLPAPRVAINLSASELAAQDLVRQIERDLLDAGLLPEALELEITEEVLLDRVSDETLDRLAALRGRGARIALDDFGTGYAGLAQLLRIPIDILKLDRTFTFGLGRDSRTEEIVRAMVGMAHGLGLELLAEGVETEAQATHLAALGCDLGQGFALAHPMPLPALAAWLGRNTAGEDDRVVPLRRIT